MAPSNSVASADLAAAGYLRLPQVLALVPVAPSTWWDGVKRGRYPRPVKIAPNCTAWRVADIHRLLLKLAEGEQR